MRFMSVFLFAFTTAFVVENVQAAEYFEDDRSMGSDVPGLPHYRSPEEACITGVLVRKVQGYQEGDNRQYRYRSANVGTDDGFGEYACQGVVERRLYISGANWVTVEVVATNVYGAFGTSETCTLSGFQDSETGQCGPPKCTDSCCDSSCGNGSNPIGTASGNKHQAETDFFGTGSFPLVFTRTYDSKRIWLANATPIGIGWTHRYLATISIAPPQGSSTLSEAVVYRPDGRILRFNLSGSVWTADADVAERLSVTFSGSDYVSATFTTNEDEVETYDQLGRLASITNRDGFVQTLNYTTGPPGSSSTISHNFVQTVSDPQGRSLTFGYNSGGQLTSLTDGNSAVIQYSYDGNNNLQTVTYPDVIGTKVRTYYYNESGQTGGTSQLNVLTGIQDENLQRYASWGYTSAGLANLSVHGDFSTGTIDRTALVFNSDGTTTVTDGLNQARKFTFKTPVQFLVARYIGLDQPQEGCGTRFASRGYDSNGYPNAGADFRSVQSSFVYGATDSNGHQRGLETQRDEAKTTSEERVINTAWNSTFRVPNQRTIVNHGGTTEARTDWIYNSRGQPLARCEYDLTVSGASSYFCSATGTPPAGIRRRVFTYCDAVNTAVPDPIGSGGENLGKGCPLIGLLRRADGPRSDLHDWTTYQYYLSNDASTQPKYLAGDVSQIFDALGHTTQYVSYDGNGRLTRMLDANGIPASMTYHPRGWLRINTICANSNCSTSPNDATTQTDYDGVGDAVKVTQPDNVYLSYTYDNAHRLTNITDNLGNHIDYTLDALGHRTAEKTFDVSDAVNPRRLVTRAYNSLARLTDQYDAQTRDTHFTYDGNGNRTDETDPLGTKTHWDYDGLNRLKDQLGDYQGTDASTANSTTGYSYDTRNNVTQIDDPSAVPPTIYTFDGLNDLSTLQNPDTGTTQYPSYDPAGNRLTQTDNRSVSWTMTYDALNRLLGVSYPTSALNVSYGYDSYGAPNPCAATSYPVGRRTSMTDASGNTVYCYDLRGNVTQKIQVAHGYRFDTRYSYNLADRLLNITYPSGAQVVYTRDADGRIQTVGTTPPGGTSTPLITNLTWQPFGPAITSTFSLGGQTLTKAYDQNYWLTDVAGSALNLHFCRDAESNITKLASTSPACTVTASEQYMYDALYRLTHVQNGTGSNLQDFTYDLTGDRLTKTLDPNPAQVYTYTPNTHHLDGIGANARLLDPNGNTTEITGSATLDFNFDDRNRMVAVSRNSSLITGYDYNAKGERVYKSTIYPSSDTRWFSYAENSALLGEYAAASLQEYVWTDATPVAVLTTSGKTLTLADRIFANGFETPPTVTNTLAYVHSDQLDSPRAVTSTAGASQWAWPWQSNPFGETAPSGALTVNLRFPGQYADTETGLNYNQSRDYESATGRYIESDPIGLSGGIDTYAYVASRPMLWLDPAGQQGSDCLGNYGITTCDGKGNWEIRNCDHGCTRPCTQEHESRHLQDYTARYGANSCRGVPNNAVPTDRDHHVLNKAPGGDYDMFRAWTECHGFRAGKKCAEGLSGHCKDDPEVKQYLDTANYYLNYYKCDAYHW